MAYFVLKVEKHYGRAEEVVTQLVEAADRQMVKYKYHKSMKEIGYHDTQHSTHYLENWDMGINADIHSIQEVSRREWEVLGKYLYSW
jgi:hypothetical protein